MKINFKHVILEGDSYSVGKQQAKLIMNNPQVVRFVTSGKTKSTEKKFQEGKEFFEVVK